ncbi:hypothetical protein ABG768_017263, partial [Culter alburnus]
VSLGWREDKFVHLISDWHTTTLPEGIYCSAQRYYHNFTPQRKSTHTVTNSQT